MKLPIAYYGNTVLRQKTAPVKEVDDRIKQLVADMEETRIAYNGIGLAAPQVNQSISLFITCVPIYDEEDRRTGEGKLRVFINPKIINHSDELCAFEEGCLSIPGLHSSVIRPVAITIQAMNLEGETFTEELTGLDARVFMHENDHLNGVLYVDRLPPPRKKEVEQFLRELKKKYQ